MSSFLHTNMCSCGPYLLKIVITTIWQWIFSTILLRKLLSFLGLTISPGNLSPLSGPCLVKYCFKKHSLGLFFRYVPGKELTCRWLQQLIRSQSSALLLPCARSASLARRAYSLALRAFGLQAGQKLMSGTWLQILVKYCIYALWESAKFHCCRINELMRLWLKCFEKVMRELLLLAPRQLYIAAMVYPCFRFSQVFP